MLLGEPGVSCALTLAQRARERAVNLFFPGSPIPVAQDKYHKSYEGS